MIEDCYKYDSTTHSVTTGTSLYVNAFEELSTNTDYDISANFTSTSGDKFHITFVDLNGDGGNSRGIYIESNYFKRTTPDLSNISVFSSPFSIRWVRESTTVDVYLNGSKVDTFTDSTVSDYKYLRLVSWSNSKTVTWSNLKIKSL